MRVAITCPVYVTNNEHLKWLDLTTESIVSKNHDIIFLPVENYVAPEFRPIAYRFKHEPLEVKILKGREPQSVASAWNLGISEGAKLTCQYVIIINTDIIFKSSLVDNLVAFAEKQRDAVMWTASEYVDWDGLEACPEDQNYSEHPNFSCYMVRYDFFDNVGLFDENFIPAYVEDGDMHARLALAHKKALVYGGAKFYHQRSTTIKSDREAWNKNTKSFPRNQQYFLEKWGHPVVGDVEEMRKVYYKHPFNKILKPLSFWEREKVNENGKT